MCVSGLAQRRWGSGYWEGGYWEGGYWEGGYWDGGYWDGGYWEGEGTGRERLLGGRILVVFLWFFIPLSLFYSEKTAWASYTKKLDICS